MKIIKIHPDSQIVSEAQPGDILLKINGQRVRDILDYCFLGADEELELEMKRGDDSFIIKIEKYPDEQLGLEFAPLKPLICGNNCLFCFIDQNPPGARDSLKVKDEDYRFSFLHGNYITLSNLGKASLDRIIRCHLSPLYISVHAYDSAVRNRLLNRRKDDGFIRKFEYLLKGGIILHTQVVIVPDYNDGEILADTIEWLGSCYPGVASVGVIPVGLTRHRKELPPLRLITADEALGIIEMVEKYRARFERAKGCALVYCADELFLTGGKPIPDYDYYDDYPQLGNGVGMARKFLDDFKVERERFPKSVFPPKKVLMVTGSLFSKILESEVVPLLQGIMGLSVEVIPLKNRYFGYTVTVANLIAGEDILHALRGKQGNVIILPPDILNDDGLFLDNLSIGEFNSAARMKAIPFPGSFRQILDSLSANDDI